MKFYTDDNVWDAALKRIRFIFENEPNVYVSSSGGKDSTVVTELAIMVARDMGRLPVNVAFLDQESEYQSTVDYFRKLKQRPEVKLYWFQVPFNLGSNVTTGDQIYLHAWRPEEKDKWMRKQEPDSIHDYGPCNEGPDMRFHRCVDLMGEYIFGRDSHYMAMLEMRADESLARYSVMCKQHIVYKHIQWASREANTKNGFKCYPIYDWAVSDIWKAISTNHWSYNSAYDLMYKIGLSPNTMRVSSLVHETGIHELKILQRIEPKTWEKLSMRIYGVNTFKHMHSSDMYSVKKLPAFFASWNEYRDYLLEKICTDEARAIFLKAFKNDMDTDDIKCLKAQVNTIVMNDVNLTKYHNFLVNRRFLNKQAGGHTMLREEIANYVSGDMAKLNEVREWLHELSANKHNPVDNVQWVPIDKVKANNYNPNAVARYEMNLLYTSIKHDGYTQPVVTYYDKEKDTYIIVDGFHRYQTMKNSPSLRELNHGLLPVVVIDKDINDRRASTVRHNRARGEHQVDGMADLVYQMLKDGWQDAQICNELGMEPEELVRLKYITGFAKMYEKYEYSQSWVPGVNAKSEKGESNERGTD